MPLLTSNGQTGLGQLYLATREFGRWQFLLQLFSTKSWGFFGSQEGWNGHWATSMTRKSTSFGPNLALVPHTCDGRYDQTYLIHKKWGCVASKRGKKHKERPLRPEHSCHGYKNRTVFSRPSLRTVNEHIFKIFSTRGFFSSKSL